MPDNDLPQFDPEEYEDDELTERRDRAPESHFEDEEDTDDIDLSALEQAQFLDPDNEDDVPFHLPKSSESNQEMTTPHPRDPNQMLTMPHFKEPGTVDPKVTLPGSGGLDPNPDMIPYDQQRNSPAEKTVMNLPKAQPAPPARQPDPAVPRPEGQMTMMNPNLAGTRYQRPAQQAPVQPSQGDYMPPPPQAPGQAHPQQRPIPRRRRRRILGLRPGCLYMLLGLMLTFCGGLTLMTIAIAAIFVPRIEEQWTAQVAGIDDYRAFESTFYFDRYGNRLYESFNEGRRDTVTYDAFPPDLINATVAIEDHTFWSNLGVDIPATVVAALNYFGSGDSRVPGGSTITQQVVRNVLFDFERRNEYSVNRKLEEIMLALALTSRRSKEDILTMYLNEIYYGNLAYGTQAAAQTFFGKNVADLTLGEAALLAGLPQAPRDLDPLDPDPTVQARVYDRWRTVLNEMVEEKFISAEQRDAALRGGLNYVLPDDNNLRAPHFTIYAQNEFVEIMEGLGYSPEVIARGGYRVYTTIDQEVNNVALGAARTQVSNLTANNVSNAAVVVIQPITGQIIGMVGSIDYNSATIDGRFNAAIGLRQPGSTMKPFTYASALERGMTAGDVIWDVPTQIPIAGQEPYRPRNYDNTFHGPIIMRTALANSYNIPAVQTLRLVGVDYLLGMMQRVGVETLGTDSSRYGLSLTLGGGEVSLLELANGYAVFANQGAYVQATAILCIVDSDSNIVYQYENGCPSGAGNFTSRTLDKRGFGTQAIDPRVAYIITDILSDNVARSTAMGSNSALRTDGIGTSVKTGTTNDVKDNWTVGYTRNVAVGVCVGNNNGDPLRNSSGLTGAAPIWNSVITSIYTRPGLMNAFRTDGQLLPDIPNPPSGMTQQRICDVRAITDPSTGCPRQVTEWFLNGPAGIPDANGNLVFPQAPAIADNRPTNATLQEISPDIYQALVFPLPPEVAAGIQFRLQPGELPPPAPRYCRVTPEQSGQGQAAGAQALVFIAGPSTSQSDAVHAEEWAQARNLAYLPTIDCWPDVFSYTGGSGWGAPVVTAVITSPANGQAVGNPVTFIGTVQFDSSQAEFWHLDIIGGPFGDWTPMGGPGYNSVVNGALFTGDLQPGSYRVRLRLVKDGNYLQQPYEVSFTVQ